MQERGREADETTRGWLTPGVKLGLFVLPFFLLLPPLWEKFTNPWNYWQYLQEDEPVEWATALFYLFAVIPAVILAQRFRRQSLALHACLIAGLGALMIFVGMEEISWGQRVLGIETPPSLAEINLQDETNLHNLVSHLTWQVGFVIIGLYGIFADKFMPWLLRPFFGSKAASIAVLVSPPGFLKSYFFVSLCLQLLFLLSPVLLNMFGPAWGFGHKPDDGFFLLSRDREIAECIQALGFLIFTCWLFYLHRIGQWRSS